MAKVPLPIRPPTRVVKNKQDKGHRTWINHVYVCFPPPLGSLAGCIGDLHTRVKIAATRARLVEPLASQCKHVFNSFHKPLSIHGSFRPCSKVKQGAGRNREPQSAPPVAPSFLAAISCSWGRLAVAARSIAGDAPKVALRDVTHDKRVHLKEWEKEGVRLEG